jgi:hypothetical protein
VSAKAETVSDGADAGTAEFRRVVAALGHDVDWLRDGGVACTDLWLQSLEEANGVLCHATAAQRETRGRSFFSRDIALRSRLGQGVHDRAEARMFATGVAAVRDARGIEAHLPLHVKAVSVLWWRVPTGEAWELSGHAGRRAGLDEEDLYLAVNVGTLVLEAGAVVRVRGDVLGLLCQRVVCLGGGAGGPPCRIEIGPALPVAGAVAGRAGPDGQDGAAAPPLPAVHSLLGPVLAAGAIISCGDGQAGTAGSPGGSGGHGLGGRMCKLAEITIRALEGSLTVACEAGAGGDGAPGGSGGAGGRGGNGRDGAVLLRGEVPPSNGGAGGHGGYGGPGGRGGHGGISSNIYVEVPPGCEHLIRRESWTSRGGAGGEGGIGGRGGTGGRGGMTAASGESGRGGPDGIRGCDGASALSGRSRPAAAIFVNGRRRVAGEVGNAD